MSTDEPFRAPGSAAIRARADALPEDREEWSARCARHRRDHRFAKIWLACWSLAAVAGYALTGLLLMPFFVAVALIAGVVGLITDGRRHRRLRDHGRQRGWL